MMYTQYTLLTNLCIYASFTLSTQEGRTGYIATCNKWAMRW